MGVLAGWSGLVLGACSEAGCAFLVGGVEASPLGGAWAFVAPEASPFGGGDVVVGVAPFGFGELVAPVPAVRNGFATPVLPAVDVPGVLRGEAAAPTGFAPGTAAAPATGLLAEAVPVAEG